jgi:hypothetical protein
VDVTVRLPNGELLRERRKFSGTSKSGAQRWGEDRERYLLIAGKPQREREVSTFEYFAPRFLDGYVRANRQKPSGIAAKETILRIHMIPALGPYRLDAITNERVQRLKLQLQNRKPKTVLTVLNVLLRTAIEWRPRHDAVCGAVAQDAEVGSALP